MNVIVETFRAAMAEHGLIANSEIRADGELRRLHVEGDKAGSKNLSYALYADQHPAGWFHDHKRGIKATWKLNGATRWTAADVEALRRQNAERERERAAERGTAAKLAAQVFEAGSPVDMHPYLERRDVTLPAGSVRSLARTPLAAVAPDLCLPGNGDVLVVPVRQQTVSGAVVLASLQFITSDGEKRFLDGGSVRAGFCVLGDSDSGPIIAIAEGLATAASVHLATGWPTVVAFFASNMRLVAEGIRRQYGSSTIVICADRDANGVGERCGRAAAAAVRGILAISPINSDFNDQQRTEGLEAVRAVLEQALESPHLTATENEAEIVSAEDLNTTVVEPYHFAPAFAADHFVCEWITFFSAQCDAALEFFEATALVALSLATHGMQAHLSGSAEPLRTNLYVLLVGDAGASRKTTAKDFQVGVANALPDITRVLPEMASHEGTVEALSEASGHSALWAVDEMGPQLDRLMHAQHLAGMFGLILEMYGKTSYTYKRVSKRRKKSEGGNGERESDDFHISDVTLSIIGCCTPTILNKLTTEAVESGLLPRFAIIMPNGKPERQARYQLETRHQPTKLVTWLRNIAQRVRESAVRFDPEALALLDREIDLPIEQNATHDLMLKRMGVMAQKVAMLAAAGRLEFDRLVDNQTETVTVTVDDARSAIIVVRRWIEYSKVFETRLNESAFEKNLMKCLDIVRGRSEWVNRRDIARRVHLSARDLREVETTLIQREQIEVREEGKVGVRSSWLWKWLP